MRVMLPIGVVVVAATLGLTVGGASAKNEIQKECAQKYQAAKAANQLNGQTYNQYYKACAAEAKADKPAATPTTTTAPAPAPTPTPTTTTKPAPTPKPTTTAKKAPPAAAPGGTVFPTAVSPEFSKESAGKQRFKTCLAQYNSNKTTNSNGGLKWIEKGGGYYSECNKRLKG